MTSLSGMLWGLSSVRWLMTQLMSLPLSAGLGTSRYSLLTVTMLSVPGLVTTVPLPLTTVTHFSWAGGFPLADSQRATTTGLSPAVTVTMDAEFLGLAEGG